jgi:hypothetical protein
MCEFSNRLICFLDHELPAEEAMKVELHLETCDECRGQLSVYAKISREVDSFCHEALGVNASNGEPNWVSLKIAAGVTAAGVLALFLAWPRALVTPPQIQVPLSTAANFPASTRVAMPAPVPSARHVHRQRGGGGEPGIARVQSENALPDHTATGYFASEEPIIQIAIPADDLYPPGAVPEGINFVADVAIRADASGREMQLRPQLTGFERRSTEP